MTGVRYGLGLDLDALLGALRAPDPEHVERGTPRLAIADKGLTAAEGVVLARYWMLRRVYRHHTNRATIAMVKFAVDALRRAGRFDMEAYFEQMLFANATSALAYLAQAMDGAIEQNALGEGEWVNSIAGLLGGNRAIYKRLATVARSDEGDEERAIYDMIGACDDAGTVNLIAVCKEAVESVAERGIAVRRRNSRCAYQAPRGPWFRDCGVPPALAAGSAHAGRRVPGYRRTPGGVRSARPEVARLPASGRGRRTRRLAARTMSSCSLGRPRRARKELKCVRSRAEREPVGRDRASGRRSGRSGHDPEDCAGLRHPAALSLSPLRPPSVTRPR